MFSKVCYEEPPYLTKNNVYPVTFSTYKVRLFSKTLIVIRFETKKQRGIRRRSGKKNERCIMDPDDKRGFPNQYMLIDSRHDRVNTDVMYIQIKIGFPDFY